MEDNSKRKKEKGFGEKERSPISRGGGVLRKEGRVRNQGERKRVTVKKLKPLGGQRGAPEGEKRAHHWVASEGSRVDQRSRSKGIPDQDQKAMSFAGGNGAVITKAGEIKKRHCSHCTDGQPYKRGAHGGGAISTTKLQHGGELDA